MSSSDSRAKELLLAALAQPAAHRHVFLTRACGDDEALRQEIDSLMAVHDESAGEGIEGGATEAPTESFAVGALFAGRYRMIARIGRGGMGDVWRADDLVLDTPVALKVIHSTTAAGRAGILNEVRLARQITHPAVCRVFDVGEAEGQVFFSMELVSGEDLAVLLRRVGRLPSEKVVDIARQLCGGLASAHAQGVLHRDLKPANVLIDDQGLVRITDFGIAITRDDGGRQTLIGTPAYMAPEQLIPGTPLSERTDVYALGLVLYELLTGQLPFTAAGPDGVPPRPSALVPNVDPQLERIVLQAIAMEPGARPASAVALARGLPAAPTGAASASTPSEGQLGMRWRASWIGAAVAVAAAAVAIALIALTGRTGALTAQDTIMLADFQNTTGEPVFDGALKVALAVALEQSPFLRVFPDERVGETLRLMERAPGERVTPAIAREVAQREQLKALLTGSIVSLGRNYVIALEAVDAATGDVMAREQVEATGKEQVLTALGGAASRLREKLGESLASVQKFDVPLPRATTPSLEALHSYALALDEGRLVPRLESIPHLRRAIELDPDFALAQALLSGVYANTGQSSLAPALSRRAFELRERVSERERFFISWRYYRDALQSWDQARDLAQTWTETYPREAAAFNSLGLASLTLGEYPQAIEAFREAVRLDPGFVTPYSNLASALAAMHRFDEAKAVLRQADEQRADLVNLHRWAYRIAFVEGDVATMTRERNVALAMPEAVSVSNWEARTSAFAGRLGVAHAQFARGIQVATQDGFRELASAWAMEDAEAHAAAGQCVEAQREVATGLAASRDNFALERASRVLGVCGARQAVSALAAELTNRFPQATLTHRVMLPMASAALAIYDGDPSHGLELLEPVRPYDRSEPAEFWPPYLRGQAYLRLADGPAAAREFQSIVDRRGEMPDSPLYPLAHLGLGRAARLSGDPIKARASYSTFLTFWSDADAGLQPVREARLELARLP